MTTEKLETATLGGGCFWCTEAVFDDLQGVTDVVSGYCNGHTQNPTYPQVCEGTTGHNEVVKVVFDTNVISYTEILNVFFAIHDPTTLNRQGNDRGTQYRSGIYFHTQEQEKIANDLIAKLEGDQLFDAPIVTEVVAAETFYPAEDYHQNYFKLNPNQGYCMAVVSPKLSKFRQKFIHKLKSKA
jgi:peptide-methionine (S)-S-oxide reductase